MDEFPDEVDAADAAQTLLRYFEKHSEVERIEFLEFWFGATAS